MAAVLNSLHLTGAAVTALEQLTEIVRKQGQVGRDPFKTASRLDEARRDLRRKQPVHHYRLLGLTQACTDAEVSSSDSLTHTWHKCRWVCVLVADGEERLARGSICAQNQMQRSVERCVCQAVVMVNRFSS